MGHSVRAFRHLLAGVALVSLMGTAPAYSQTTQTLGRIVPGAIPSSGLTAQMKRASRFTLASPGTVKQLCAYLDGKGGVSGYERFRYALYADSSGVPGAKILETNEATILSGDAARWICFPVPLHPVSAGAYWIAIHTGGDNSGVIRDFYDGNANNWYGNADPFDDGSSPTFGAGNAGTGTLTVYAEYFPDSQLRNAGRTTVGTKPSGGMTADFKRGSSFTMPERGKLYTITAYLDGGGTAVDAQQVFRYALYKDANGVPGAKVYESYDQYMRSGWPANWITDPPYPGSGGPTLDPGRYWIVILTGATGGVTRNYADGTGNWYGNSDAFADGASTQFGPGNAGNGTISAFISYRPGTVTEGQLGRTDIGTAPSAGLSANRSRWSQFTLNDDIYPLSGLHAYLDGLGGASGSQKVRLAIYGMHADQETAWFEKIAQSQDVTITAGMSPRWVDFAVPSVRMSALYPVYLIVLQTGDTAGVIRDYGDNRPEPGGNWYSMADPFADGAVDRIPSLGTTPGSVTLSVYATYSLPPP